MVLVLRCIVVCVSVLFLTKMIEEGHDFGDIRMVKEVCTIWGLKKMPICSYFCIQKKSSTFIESSSMFLIIDLVIFEIVLFSNNQPACSLRFSKQILPI